ncbi:hypothetical protein B0T25DRAFT_566417 [Lasiosphaeria hispida]|uniref:Uncharacterized protein n=1 Tax=Lasiosphaeria hispida TaxID=260671 RepID=A0AAJ0HM31_9PEZI|nr:hypothetical protein B0T25DRAFT_566417 [Lasiosphaeria hispida]
MFGRVEVNRRPTSGPRYPRGSTTLAQVREQRARAALERVVARRAQRKARAVELCVSAWARALFSASWEALNVIDTNPEAILGGPTLPSRQLAGGGRLQTAVVADLRKFRPQLCDGGGDAMVLDANPERDERRELAGRIVSRIRMVANRWLSEANRHDRIFAERWADRMDEPIRPSTMRYQLSENATRHRHPPEPDDADMLTKAMANVHIDSSG